MPVLVLKFINLAALLLAVVWLSRSPDWEPLVTSIGLFATLIGLEIQGLKGAREKRNNPDRQLFEAFLEVLPSHGSIEFIKTHNIGGTFDPEELNDLRRFTYEWIDPEHEFLNNRLEKKRRKLHELTEQYLYSIAVNTFPTHSGRQRVLPRWELERPKPFGEVVNELHDLADQVADAHQDLVRTARKTLNV